MAIDAGFDNAFALRLKLRAANRRIAELESALEEKFLHFFCSHNIQGCQRLIKQKYLCIRYQVDYHLHFGFHPVRIIL